MLVSIIMLFKSKGGGGGNKKEEKPDTKIQENKFIF